MINLTILSSSSFENGAVTSNGENGVPDYIAFVNFMSVIPSLDIHAKCAK